MELSFSKVQCCPGMTSAFFRPQSQLFQFKEFQILQRLFGSKVDKLLGFVCVSTFKYPQIYIFAKRQYTMTCN